MSNSYVIGTDLLGAIIPLAQAGGPQPALVIRVKNAEQLVRAKGGAAGALAFDIAPQATTSKIYSEMRNEMIRKFKEQGVDADVQIVTSPPSGPPPKKEFVSGMAAGAGAVGVGWLLWKLIRVFV